jgi:hypothetical protein
LPAGYDSRKLLYRLFVPDSYRRDTAWPLVVFVAPGDVPLGWKAWQKPCEHNDWLYAAAIGAGNDCPPAQRVRALCDVLDDIRRHYRVDPDRTYLAGFGGGAGPAFRLATALPELFGGVILLGGDGKLPGSDHLRERLRERLSVALVCGDGDRGRASLEKFRLPLLTGLGVRARLWLVLDHGPALPSSGVLMQVQNWLEEDLDRRRADSRAQGLTADETPTRAELTARALARARDELRQPGQTYRAGARLKWVTARFGSTAAARAAEKLLGEVRADPERGGRLTEQTNAATHVRHTRPDCALATGSNRSMAKRSPRPPPCADSSTKRSLATNCAWSSRAANVPWSSSPRSVRWRNKHEISRPGRRSAGETPQFPQENWRCSTPWCRLTRPC